MRGCITLGACLALAASAFASTGSGGDLPAGTEALMAAFPGVKATLGDDGRVRVLSGARMTSADSPAQAAEWFLADHLDAFGIENLELVLERSQSVNPLDKWTVFVYRQIMDGVPVEFGHVRVLVANGSPSAVILASAKLATPPVGGFAADSINAEQALEFAQSYYPELTIWSTPELVVYYGEGDMPSVMTTPVRAWKVRGENTLTGDDWKIEAIFINASNAEIVHIRSEVYNVDVTGTAHGLATPYLPKDNMYPDYPGHEPIDQILEGSEASIGATKVTVGQDGTFVIPNEGETDVTVTGLLIHPKIKTLDSGGPEITATAVVTPPGPAELFYNSTPAATETAELNGHIHSVNEYDFVKALAPDFGGFDSQTLTVSVNQNSTCNATYGGNQTNFYKAGGGCPNTAYSSVVTHEMGHYLVEKLGLAQNAFGEGNGDAIGNLMYNDPMTGRDFLAVGQILRNPVDANKQYPCNDEIHECGMVVSGFWWDTHLNLGEDVMLPLVQQLYVDWMMITNGEQDFSDGIGPVNVPEVLAVADDDENPDTKGPYDDAICGAFVKHGIVPCGDITILNFEFVNVNPADLTGLPCDVDNTFCLKITDGTIGTLDHSTVQMVYKNRTDQLPRVTVSMTETSPNVFEGTIPAIAADKEFFFWFQAETTDGVLVTEPAGGGRYVLTTDCAVPAFPPCDEPPPVCEGDVNGDGAIDPLDTGYSLSRFGCSVGTGDAECDAADANADGIVDPLDVGYILSRFGVCP